MLRFLALSEREPALFQIEKYLKDFYQKITKAQKIAFLSALLVGLVVHIIPLTGPLWNHDTHIGSEDPSATMGWLLVQGKWLIELLFAIEGAGDCYIIHLRVFVSLVFLAAAAALVVEFCNIQSGLYGAITGAIMASFPSVMSIFFYYNITIYLWIIFLACLCVFVQYKHPGVKGGIASTLLLVLTLGAYPPYLTIVASGYLLLLLQDILLTQKKVKEIFLYAVRLLAQLIAGIGGYYIILQLVLRVKNTELQNYKNVDQMAHIEWGSLPDLIQQAYGEVLSFFINGETYAGAMKHLYCIMIFVLSVSLVFLVVKRHIYCEPLRLVLLVLVLGLFPLSVSLNTVISKGEYVHWMMKYAFVMIPILTVKLVSDSLSVIKLDAVGKNIAFSEYVFAVIQQWGAVLLCFLMVYRWSVTCSEGYLRSQISYEKSYALLTNVVDDLYESGMTKPDQEIAFIYEHRGQAQNITVEYLPGDYDGVPNGSFMLTYDGVFERYAAMILGIGFWVADAESQEAILQTEEFAQMPCYPYMGYIQEINNVLVVKFSDKVA